MLKAFLAICVASVISTAPAIAQDRVTLGLGRLMNNDTLGDGEDRWRSGSFNLSLMRGQPWRGALPDQFGELLEYRLRTEIIAPSNLTTPNPADRRYVGALSLGVQTHFALGSAEARLGADLVFTGKQTGLGEFQKAFHDLFGLVEPQVLDDQIPNAVYPTISGEIGQGFALSDNSVFRPFVEAQAGVETYLRIGGDVMIGNYATGALMLRDPVTGQRHKALSMTRTPGVSFNIGGDVAHVFDSAYLPDGDAAELKETRSRLRAGLAWTGRRSEVFYGLTWLGKEFEDQPDTQLVGSLNIRLRF